MRNGPASSKKEMNKIVSFRFEILHVLVSRLGQQKFHRAMLHGRPPGAKNLNCQDKQKANSSQASGPKEAREGSASRAQKENRYGSGWTRTRGCLLQPACLFVLARSSNPAATGVNGPNMYMTQGMAAFR